jgi:hypothetical protein
MTLYEREPFLVFMVMASVPFTVFAHKIPWIKKKFICHPMVLFRAAAGSSNHIVLRTIPVLVLLEGQGFLVRCIFVFATKSVFLVRVD